VEGDQRLFAGLGLDVLENLFLVIDKEIALLVAGAVTVGMGFLQIL
jgi:hypothetical protein